MFRFKYLSKLSISVCGLVFAVGVVVGWMMYQNRSGVAQAHVAGSNAILAHAYIALLCAAAIAVSIFYHRFAPKTPYIIWAAPFTKTALANIKRTAIPPKSASRTAILRAVAVTLLTGLSLFYFFRAGMQVLAALDHNVTVNAWGGPSYLGASFAHWMDAAVLFYVQAFVIYWLVRPGQKKAARHSPKKRQRH